jgi:hypothetical protein
VQASLQPAKERRRGKAKQLKLQQLLLLTSSSSSRMLRK